MIIGYMKNFQRDFKINESFVQYVTTNKIPLVEIGQIVLRFAMTNVLSGNRTVPSPFLNSKDHLRVLTTIQQSLGLSLPTQITADFLFFQTANENIHKAVNHFVQIRSTIVREYLDFVALPSKIYASWELAATSFIETFVLTITKGNFPSAKSGQYPEKIMQLAFFLHLATYPS